MLQDCLNDNSLKSILNEKCFQPSYENVETLANKLKKKQKNFIDIVTSKLCMLIISKKVFMQIVGDKFN